jgi:hypothetical protein
VLVLERDSGLKGSKDDVSHSKLIGGFVEGSEISSLIYIIVPDVKREIKDFGIWQR